ncbi:hypothetical protein AZA_88306 [Nitrospirillum viridazoti Y2]|nr:hypothetical protein AZA_88306 [Nitrospirillum amazonense Y2]
MRKAHGIPRAVRGGRIHPRTGAPPYRGRTMAPPPPTGKNGMAARRRTRGMTTRRRSHCP